MSVKHPIKVQPPVYNDVRGGAAIARSTRQRKVAEYGVEIVETIEARRYPDEDFDDLLPFINDAQQGETQ